MAERYFEGQHEDENVLFVFRKHIVDMRWGLVYLAISLLVGMIPVAIKPDMLVLLWFTLAGFLFGLLVLFFYWMSWYFSVFIVTDQRIIQVTQKGFFHRTIVDLGLDRILSVNYEVAGLEATMLHFGTISIQTYVGDLVIEKVGHPAVIYERISSILKKLDIKPVDPGQGAVE